MVLIQLAAEVLPSIRTRTADAIIDVEKKPDGTVVVQTGTLVPYRSGGGSYYILRKHHGQWRIVSEGVWIV